MFRQFTVSESGKNSVEESGVSESARERRSRVEGCGVEKLELTKQTIGHRIREGLEGSSVAGEGLIVAGLQRKEGEGRDRGELATSRTTDGGGRGGEFKAHRLKSWIEPVREGRRKISRDIVSLAITSNVGSIARPVIERKGRRGMRKQVSKFEREVEVGSTRALYSSNAKQTQRFLRHESEQNRSENVPGHDEKLVGSSKLTIESLGAAQKKEAKVSSSSFHLPFFVDLLTHLDSEIRIDDRRHGEPLEERSSKLVERRERRPS